VSKSGVFSSAVRLQLEYQDQQTHSEFRTDCFPHPFTPRQLLWLDTRNCILTLLSTKILIFSCFRYEKIKLPSWYGLASETSCHHRSARIQWLFSIPTAAKYDSTIERVAKALRPVSTQPEEDLLLLFRRALFAWLIADGDMHLKNLAVLRTATPGERSFLSVRLAPVYDTLTTRVFPVLAQDRMALKLNGKDDRLQTKDFLALARTIGIKVMTAEEEIEKMARELMLALQEVRLPPMSNYGSQGLERFAQIQEIVETRCQQIS
jgi:hypothetical protein